jgi:hypothetical protein
MGQKILIKAGNIEVAAELNDSATAKAIMDIMPIKSRANTWGDEIYFSIPASIEPEEPREVVDIGDLGYWPPGTAFCLFFGLTPMSRGNEIRPASPVNMFGKITGDPTVLKKVPSGAEITVEKAVD